jgi:metal-dependent amidase/aminoacylase/carboxypeptidase family protein
MSGNKCRKTYEEMKAKRLAHPFAHSAYKLKEVAAHFESGMDDVKRIARFKNGKGTKHDLRSCTSEDIHIYLRKTPELIAWRLGFTNIKHEYENFKHGDSDVFELLVKAMDITDRILNEAKLSRF